jgi:methyl-accepting chemotaxis protein
LLISILTYSYTYNEAKKALKEQMREELFTLTSVFSSQIDGDYYHELKTEDDMENDAFMAVHAKLNDLRGDNDKITYIYTMNINEKGEVIFLVDGDYLNDDGTVDVALFDIYEDAPVDDIRKGLSEIYVGDDFYTDDWGTFLSGYGPIYDSENNVVAILALDIDAKSVKEKQEFIGSLFYVVILVAIIFAGLIILFFSKTIIKDLNGMQKVAVKMSNGELDVEFPEIKSKNEMYELNEAIKGSFAAIEFLQGEIDSKDNAKKDHKNN